MKRNEMKDGGPNWLGINFCPTKTMTSQNLGLPKSRLPKLGQKTYSLHVGKRSRFGQDLSQTLGI
jgi:hypothetical protein